jgi:putative acetyltransferase
MISLQRTDSNNPAFRQLIAQLDKDLHGRYDIRQEAYDVHNRIVYLDTVVIAFVNETAAGCGCFKRYDDKTVEVKRMFVSPANRGKGIASAILAELETWATELGNAGIVLETGTGQPEAIALYKKKGYKVIPNYGPYLGMGESVCMGKKSLSVKQKNLAGQH